MATRARTKITVKKSDPDDAEEEHKDQPQKPDSGRFRLQVDRQTKASSAKYDDAEAAGSAIKKGFPVVQVVVYDTVESVSSLIELSKEASGRSAD